MRSLYPTLLCFFLFLTLSPALRAQLPGGSDEFTLTHLSSYLTGSFDEAAAEIVAYDLTSQRLFFTSGDANTITILELSNPSALGRLATIDMSPYGGGVNSVAAYNGLVAAAVEGNDTADPGTVVLMDTDGQVLNTIAVGVLPDHLSFAQNGTKILTANEGEPNDDYTVDPEGSVSIIDLSQGMNNTTVVTVNFNAFDDRKAELINQGVRIYGPGATVSQDLEPEYLTVVDDSIAYVALQENNALALININSGELIDIKALGYKNHATGRPNLTEYVLNELIDMPDLGTPTYGGGQPTVKLGGFSGMYFDEGESTDTELVFYAVPDRGPNDGAINRNNVVGGNPTNLRPFKLPNYQGRIAKFTLNTQTGAVTLDEQVLLTRQDGTTPISGRGNIPGFDETPVVPADATGGTSTLLDEDFEDEDLSPFVAVNVASNVGWEIRNFSGSDNYAEMNGFSADVASDDWLVGPALDLNGATSVTFSFESTANFDGPELKVLVANDYNGDVSTATWVDISDRATLSAGNNDDTPSGDISLNDFIDQTINIAFQYTSTAPGAGGGRRWQVDDVLVTSEINNNGDFVDTDGNAYTALDFDEFGGDFESIVRDPDGNFWMCDEYRPAIYAFTPTGVLINRFVPAGTSQLGTTPQPAGTYGMETLPAVYAKRRANRGFEGMALNTDDGLLYAFIQSPIENPNNSVRNNSNVIRVLAVDPSTGTAVAEYVYLLENNANRSFDIGRVDKIGDVVYTGNGKFLVLERDSSVPGQDEGKKYVFEIMLTGATDILGMAVSTEDGSNGATLEEMTADELVAMGVQSLHKTKVLNLPSIGYLPSDKPEGIALLPDGSIAVLNDNDFGLAGAGVSDNSTLGIISFNGDNGFDASNRDDVINITSHPTLGMFQPDAIASYSVDGVSYIVTANEGDARDYDGFGEETRVGDLILDPTAYPDAATLQEDENLGRLRTTTATGDIDGDGDVDQIYSYGARSFSIFDRFGNLVYDSGDELERIVAAALPDDFNSTNDENGSFDSRSDDKGPEPEAIEIVVNDNKVYALIGLERVGGVVVYNITDPRAPTYVSYINNRVFNGEAQREDGSSNPAVGDLGVEDIIYIPALESPNGEDLVVTANEVSGTISIFGVNQVITPPLTLRILHNNDGESKIVADTLDDGRAFGGADRFLTVLEDLRTETLPTITLSSGDNYLPGQAFNASLARAEGLPLFDSEVLDAIGYDALVIGNHDFDFGPDILQRVIEETAGSSPTFLSANLDFTAEPGLQALVDAGRIAKREVVTTGGEQIGVVGLTTISLPTISTPRGVRVDSNLVAIAQGEIDALLAEGINKIILISHLQGIDEELMLAAELTDVDVIIAGGGDELLTNDPANALGGLTVDDVYPRVVQDAEANDVYIVTTPGEYRYVGNLIVDFDEDGIITAIDEDSDVVPVVGDIEGNEEIAAIVDSINAFTAELDANVIAVTEVDLDGLRASVRTIETNQGNLITDAYLWFFNEVSGDFDFDASIPVVALQNGGGIRDDEIIPAGSNITESKTFDILPFSNFVSVLEPISAEEFKSALENSVSSIPGRSGRFGQIAGFEIVYDPEGTPGVDRIVMVTLDDGTPIVVDREVVAGAPSVYVVTNSFTAAGGDDYDEFAATTFTNIGPSYQRVLFDYLVAENGVNGVVTAEQYPVGGEGRIRIFDNCPVVPNTPEGESNFDLELVGSYSTGVFDEAAAEIVAHDPASQRLFFTNANDNSIGILDIANPAVPMLISEISMTSFGGGVNSVAVNDGIVAVAVQGDETDDAGTLVFLDVDGMITGAVAVGILPDMLTFTPDGTKVLTANEGEPNDDYNVDPEGSVSIVDISGGVSAATATTVNFTAFNDSLDVLLEAGVRIFGPNATVAQDLEPEYITTDNNTAYVVFQENNAIGVIDLTTESLTAIHALGFKDHSCDINGFDASNRDDALNIAGRPVLGMYMPDAITSYVVEGTTYLVTANEGDARDYDGFSEETRVADLDLDPTAYPNAVTLQDDANLGRLLSTTANGDTDGDGDVDQIYSYGARSFSIFSTTGELVYDSGSEFERIIADRLPDDFNSNNDENDSFDARSDDKGPEPEAITVVTRNDTVFALIGLERVGGIMVYNITDPAAPTFVSYTNNRDFSVDAQLADDSINPAVGDLGVEDVIYISPADSPDGMALVVTANEVSGTISLFGVNRDPVSNDELDLQELDFTAAPNPFDNGFDLSYELTNASDLDVLLTDVTGRPLRKLVSGRQPAGSNRLRINLEQMPAGMYFVRVRLNQRIRVLRMVKK